MLLLFSRFFCFVMKMSLENNAIQGTTFIFPKSVIYKAFFVRSHFKVLHNYVLISMTYVQENVISSCKIYPMNHLMVPVLTSNTYPPSSASFTKLSSLLISSNRLKCRWISPFVVGPSGGSFQLSCLPCL